MEQQLAIVFETEDTAAAAAPDVVELTLAELGQIAGGTTYVLY